MSLPRRVTVAFTVTASDLAGTTNTSPLFTLVLGLTGSAIPGFEAPAAPQPVTITAPASTTADAPKPPVDPSQPQTTLQIRLADGTRLVTQFNLSATMDDVYAFVGGARLATGREFVLQTIFPTKVLERGGTTVEEERLQGGTVVMRWKA